MTNQANILPTHHVKIIGGANTKIDMQKQIERCSMGAKHLGTERRGC
jgi:hypothetical protein